MMTRSGTDPFSVVVAGAGAIGSHLLALLARMADIGRITIVDTDDYDAGNLRSQDIRARDVGKSKARVQASRLRRLRTDLEVIPIVDDVGRVPPGRIRNADCIFSCLDSRGSRQRLNERATRLAIPWVDAGVDSGLMLVRVDVYLRGPDAPCLECAWHQTDYDLLAVDYPCSGSAERYATRAPAALGALAASLQAIEGGRVLRGDDLLVGERTILAAADHRYYDTRLTRNPNCRFDHQALVPIESLDCSPSDLTLGQAFELGRRGAPPAAGLHLRVEAGSFSRGLTCLVCGTRNALGRLPRFIGGGPGRPCHACGAATATVGTDRVEELSTREIPTSLLDRSLAGLGLRRGDVYTVSDGRDHARHFEIPWRLQ